MLDMCSSWVSHYPPGYKAGRMVGELTFLHTLPQPLHLYMGGVVSYK
jgi:hypothetical protein